MTLHFQSTMKDTIDLMPDTDDPNVPLSGTIKSMLEDYFNDLDGHPPADLYQMVLQEIEQPLLETVLLWLPLV